MQQHRPFLHCYLMRSDNNIGTGRAIGLHNNSLIVEGRSAMAYLFFYYLCITPFKISFFYPMNADRSDADGILLIYHANKKQHNINYLPISWTYSAKKKIKMLKKIAKCFADIKTIYIFGALKMMFNY